VRLGVFVRTQLPLSIQSDITHITQELKILGVECVQFSERDTLPQNVDLYWNPGAASSSPYLGLKKVTKPVVVTFHGADLMVLPIHEVYGSNLIKMVYVYRNRIFMNYGWFIFRKRCAAVVTVSNYARQEFEKYLGFVHTKVIPIYHGVDHSIFYPRDVIADGNPYFLHVSAYQPKKNLDRILAAYRRLPADKPRLVAVVPGYRRYIKDSKIEIIQKPYTHKELSNLYRNAFALLFPSLHETFGHPIMEAMASGCPVITSNTTSCVEVAGDAALLVNPRSVDEITAAMNRLLSDSDLRKTLRTKGIERAEMFSWRKSAEEYLAVFTKILRNREK
jgi:glycosyltransferase involved in cell wall biosynthesis